MGDQAGNLRVKFFKFSKQMGETFIAEQANSSQDCLFLFVFMFIIVVLTHRNNCHPIFCWPHHSHGPNRPNNPMEKFKPHIPVFEPIRGLRRGHVVMLDQSQASNLYMVRSPLYLKFSFSIQTDPFIFYWNSKKLTTNVLRID